MVSIFREQSSVSVFWLIILSVVLHSHFIVLPPQVLVPAHEEWLSSFLSPVAILPSVALVLLYHAVVIVQALRLSAVLNHLRMFPKSYFVPALCYLLLTALLPVWNNITPALLLNFAVIWLFSLMARVYNSSQARPLIFNIGLLTGILVLLFSPTLFLIPCCFIALALLRAFRLNEWFVLLLGLLTPAYLLCGVLFLYDNLPYVFTLLPHFNWHLPLVANQASLFLSCLAGSLFILSGIFAWQGNTGRMIIQTRRGWALLFYMFLLSIPLLFALPGQNFSLLLLGMVPAAALASNTFVYSKNELFQAVLFWLLTVVIIFNNWFWIKT